jgi:hypothetical protein
MSKLPFLIAMHRTRILPGHLAIRQRVAIRTKTLGADVPARAAGNTATEGVDHGRVADDHCHEGFATGPAAGLLGAVCAGLFWLQQLLLAMFLGRISKVWERGGTYRDD